MNLKKSNLINIIKIIFLVGIPILFLVMPTSFFENKRSLCIFKNLFGINCPACGSTRAVSCLAHFNFQKALEYNKLIVVTLRLISYFWIKELFRLVFSFNQKTK